MMLRGIIYVVMTRPAISHQTEIVIEVVSKMVELGIIINVGLAVFNCLPFYPLDGFHITLQLMRPESQQRFVQTMPYGPFAILALVLMGSLGGVSILMYLIRPPVELIFKYVVGV